MKTDTSPKDIFLQLFATAMLYLSIIGTFIATFVLTDWFIQSSADRYPNTAEQLGNMLSFPLAMIVVAFPLFAWSSYKLYKRMKTSDALKDSRARSWLINLTLFLAALIITITAITVVYTFFNGDLTARTLIKSAIVLLISLLTIFWYKGGENAGTVEIPQKITAVVGTIVFLAVLITGVVAMGSPAERRMQREDRELRYSMQNAYYNIESTLYGANENSVLPEYISTAGNVTYTRFTDTTATLCATFQTEYNASEEEYYAKPMPTRLGEGERQLTMPEWSHTPGEVCYDITLE